MSCPEPERFFGWEDDMNCELVQRAGNGDMQARDELIRQLMPRIERIARRYAWIDGVDQDDLKQEACIGVIEGLDRVDTRIGTPSEFLMKLARWRLLDCLKKILRQKREMLQEVEPESTELESGPDFEFDLLAGKLTGQQRVILQYLVQGYTWREIGAELGFTAANVSHHLKKIRKVYG